MPSQSSEDTPHDSMWPHLLIGPVVWVIHFFAGYGLTEIVCTFQWLNVQWLGFSVLSIAILALTLIAFLVTLYAARAAYRTWKLFGQHRPQAGTPAPVRSDAVENPHQAGHGAIRFMALSGALLSGLFALTILITGLPALVLDPCG